MQKKLSPKGKAVIKLIASLAISIVSVVTDRALPIGLDDFILSLFN